MCTAVPGLTLKETKMNSHLTCISQGIRQPRTVRIVCAPKQISSRQLALVCVAIYLLMLGAPVVGAQQEDRIVATVNGTAVRLPEVDAAASAKIFSLQQQLFAVRKSTLENLISR